MVDWSWIISQITFWRSPINRSQDGGDQDRGEEEDPGSSGVDRDAEGPIVGGGEVLGGGHLGETSHGERPKYSRHHLLLVSIFHVCIGLWVVMGLGLVGLLGVSRLGSRSQDGWAVSGEGCRLLVGSGVVRVCTVCIC